jgi:hypothetical protein
MRVKNWTLKMKLRVSRLIVKVTVLILVMICISKGVPGRKLKEQDFKYFLHHILSLMCNLYLPVTSHLHLPVSGEQQVAMGSSPDDTSLPQGFIITVAAKANHLVQQSVLKGYRQYPILMDWICWAPVDYVKSRCL